MKHVINTSEVLRTVATSQGPCEVCAAADASYDESAGRVVVKLEAFLRPAGLLVKERHFREPWLPADETITEGVDREECGDLARDIFHGWVRRVRAATPASPSSLPARP